MYVYSEVDCSLKSEVGPCKALIRRYFYNADAKECQEFNYGGCMGNSNNFIELEDCESVCGGKSCFVSKG